MTEEEIHSLYLEMRKKGLTIKQLSEDTLDVTDITEIIEIEQSSK